MEWPCKTIGVICANGFLYEAMAVVISAHEMFLFLSVHQCWIISLTAERWPRRTTPRIADLFGGILAIVAKSISIAVRMTSHFKSPSFRPILLARCKETEIVFE